MRYKRNNQKLLDKLEYSFLQKLSNQFSKIKHYNPNHKIQRKV